MLISSAWAGHGVVSTGSSGGGNALLIILAVAIASFLAYLGQKKLRRHLSGRDDAEKAR